MTPGEFSGVVKTIQGLWPRYSFGDELQEAHYRYMKHFDAVEVDHEFHRQHREDPDSIRPTWKELYRKMRAHHRSTLNDFAILLMQIRRSLKGEFGRAPIKGSDYWTDAEVFANHVLASEVVSTHCLITNTRKPDPDGQRAERAKRTREGMYRYWRRYFVETLREDPPDFLVELPLLREPAGPQSEPEEQLSF